MGHDRDWKTVRRERTSPWETAVAPPPERWDDWVELDSSAWPERRERRFRCVPTICFNCEAACGLLAYVDRETGEVDRFEGNPVHPGSRGRTCAKGPATLAQVRDPNRILHPMRRSGPRGSGRFERVGWDEALDAIGARIGRALREGRHDEIMYHVGRPGEDHFVQRLLAAWGVDGYNSHTNVCSASARLGYALWSGVDRPSPDFANADFILLLSAHLETGHYFNPHAQRIVEAKSRGARLAVVDVRLSNTASLADVWVSPWPGSEAALLLGVARELLARDRVRHDFVRRWTNWRELLEARDAGGAGTYERFLELIREEYDRFTPEYVAEECRVPVESVGRLADEIDRAGTRFASHLWRNAASGNLGGWQVARALTLLHVLTGSVGTEGGVNPAAWDKLVPRPSEMPAQGARWNELIWPREYPLGHYEMSFLLPHLMRRSGCKIDTYFTRVYNPVWTNPDGAAWIDMLSDEDAVGCHVALTPTWNETALWADWVLPMGLASERHDVMSQETHAGTWVGFRQPVGRAFHEAEGKGPIASTRETNPGQVWEEAEFWIELTWRIDPEGQLGIRRYYESRREPGTPIGLDEYFADLFEQVPGLRDAAAAEGKEPLAYMRRYGAFESPYGGQRRYAGETAPGDGVEIDGTWRKGFGTPTKKLEVWSATLAEWGWPEDALPGYVRSHVHWRELDDASGEMVLVPTFRLPTLIHTRSANAKWLQEISHANPVWIHPTDADRRGVATGDLVRLRTRIGHFVARVWVTEGIHPGTVACSHHLGRWHVDGGPGDGLTSRPVEIVRDGDVVTLRPTGPIRPRETSDPDTGRIWWSESGVHQNLAFPVQPDPVSGMHCWHQKVHVERAEPDDRHGDVRVDLARSRSVFEEWLGRTRPAPGPGGLRRPEWLNRPMRPAAGAYRLPPLGG